MEKRNLTYAKVVATPSPLAWSQAYNAGGLFAVLSLTKPLEEELSLSTLGKDIMTTLEQEYFTLEEKNLSSIKQAITTTIQKIPPSSLNSFIVASIIQNVLYIFVHGEGSVMMKRGDKIGNILDLSETTDEQKVISASGFLEDNDVILLQTQTFNRIVPTDTFFPSLDPETLTEQTEELATKIHEKDEASACAIFISYKKAPEILGTEDDDELTLPPQRHSQFGLPHFLKNLRIPFPLKLPTLKLPIGGTNSSFGRSKMIFLSLSLLILIILGIGIYVTFQNQQQSKTRQRFEAVFNSALKKYEDGQSLIGLNKTLARVDFQEAQKILEGEKDAFRNTPNLQQRIDELRGNIEKGLSETSDTSQSQATPLATENKLLTYKLKNPHSLFVSRNNNTIYSLEKDAVFSVNPAGNKSDIITGDFINSGGLSAYGNNIYILDKKANQIYKYVPSGNDYNKSNYLPQSSSASFSQVTSLAIDGSVWILSKDGLIRKYTRGQSESFTISGLEKPLASPTRIFTNNETSSLYVLDPGSSRIVVLGKDGTYKKSYEADVLRSASEIDVLESEKKIHILSGNKLWQIELQ